MARFDAGGVQPPMAKSVARIRAEPDREPRTQYAALPWRKRADGNVEVLLITSRESRRWVIPKGWPIKTLKPGPSAAQEAFEEAGVLARPEVLLEHALCVLHRHLVAGEGDHSRAQRQVRRMQGCG